MVRDLEYFAVFLRNIGHGDTRGAEKEIRQLRLQLEADKDKAVGKGKKLDENKLRLKSLMKECERLAVETGIVEIQSGKLRSTPDDTEIQTLIIGNPTDPRFRSIFLKRLWRTYTSFDQLVLTIRGAPNAEIFVSHERTGNKYHDSLGRYDLHMTQWTFEASRDLATQLGLINWRMLDQNEVASDPVLGTSAYVLYLTSRICRLSELQGARLAPPSSSVDLCVRQCLEDLHEVLEMGSKASDRAVNGYTRVPIDSDSIFVRENTVSKDQFENVLWHEYLKLTDRVPREPVYYCTLRDRVCETLRIPDWEFNKGVDYMINTPENSAVKVSPGEGSLPAHKAASKKQIPPKLFRDSYMVYLRMEKKQKV